MSRSNPSTQTHQFSQTKRAEIPRSSFNLSHGHKTTIDSGLLYPILSLEVLPGDTISLNATIFGRIATMLKPPLDNIFAETFYFFVPWRQTWEHWPEFNGEQLNPSDSTDFVIPRISGITLVGESEITDYFGLPPGLDFGQNNVSALPLRAYMQIYNFWFRNQNLIDSIPVDIGDGPDNYDPEGVHQLRRRSKRQDYLVGCLPWPQKGDPVTIELGGDVPVQTNASETISIGIFSVPEDDYRNLQDTAFVQVSAAGGVPETQRMFVNLDDASFTINDLRESFQIQKLLERDARGGTRYPEILKAHFGVIDPQMLVHQRPQFLAGGHTQIKVTQVPQTTPEDTDGAGPETSQANLAAYGQIEGGGGSFTHSFTEHGIIIGLVNIRADITYQQNLERYWSRETRYDFYWPALSHLGEQAVHNREIFVSNTSAIDEAVFGYQERYAEYRVAVG